ncbi:hypothetical protein IMCC3135_06205 [Granulosicoccus antarcticus IMCC3135]|uniref:Uncharacterized protein n=1 Tax=Granulosicoccus antarcticus IMCC3135 TaxID=1192854 RepID=A0A2Z2NNN8_9GAMM|nr:hypothetical protein IMCC3135_06205 [Granulosicoccus antarcticus IMCC3135]
MAARLNDVFTSTVSGIQSSLMTRAGNQLQRANQCSEAISMLIF